MAQLVPFHLPSSVIFSFSYVRLSRILFFSLLGLQTFVNKEISHLFPLSSSFNVYPPALARVRVCVCVCVCFVGFTYL